VLINEVMEESPAAKSGLEAGDVITKYGDTDVEGTDQFVDLVHMSSPGDEVVLTAIRDGKKKEFVVEIGKREFESKHDLEFFGEGGPYIFKHKEVEPFFHSLDLPGFACGGYIGVRIHDLNSQLAEAFDLKEAEGVLVLEAEEDSPAYKAGIRGGDVIVKVNDEEIADTHHLQSVIRQKEENEEIKVTVRRNKREKTFDVTVAESPGLSSIRKKIDIDLDDELAGLEDLHIEIQTELDEELAELKEELEILKDELKELKKELK
jgi:serine protease Do